VFLFAIPLVNLFAYLYLFLSKGTDENNTYGEPPSKKIQFPRDILNMPELKKDRGKHQTDNTIVDPLDKQYGGPLDREPLYLTLPTFVG